MLFLGLIQWMGLGGYSIVPADTGAWGFWVSGVVIIVMAGLGDAVASAARVARPSRTTQNIVVTMDPATEEEDVRRRIRAVEAARWPILSSDHSREVDALMGRGPIVVTADHVRRLPSALKLSIDKDLEERRRRRR